MSTAQLPLLDVPETLNPEIEEGDELPGFLDWIKDLDGSGDGPAYYAMFKAFCDGEWDRGEDKLPAWDTISPIAGKVKRQRPDFRWRHGWQPYLTRLYMLDTGRFGLFKRNRLTYHTEAEVEAKLTPVLMGWRKAA